MSDFSFRIRFNKSSQDTINIESPSWDITVPNVKSPLSLKSTKKDTAIRDSNSLSLHGHGWDSEEEARIAGKIYQDALMLTFVRLRVGVDFGNRSPKSALTQAGLRMLGGRSGRQKLNDIHGLMTYQREHTPLFVSLNAKAVRGIQQERFEKVFRYAVLHPRQLTERERVSIECFSSSFFQTTADTRFLLLMMAIEALLELAPRPSASRSHVEKLIDFTQRSAELTETERVSLLGSLRWLRQESINQAGRKLSSTLLGERMYMDLSPSLFFTNCYKLRSRLVHGNTPFPVWDEVSSVAAILETFVSDLLSGALIEV